MRSVLFFSRPRCEGWPHHGRTVGRLLALPTLIWFDYSNALPDAHIFSELGLRASTLKAEFHYTGPTGPDRTLSETARTQRSFAETRAANKSVRVRSGPCSGI